MGPMLFAGGVSRQARSVGARLYFSRRPGLVLLSGFWMAEERFPAEPGIVPATAAAGLELGFVPVMSE